MNNKFSHLKTVVLSGPLAGLLTLCGMMTLLVGSLSFHASPAFAQAQIAQQNPQPVQRRTLFDIWFGKSNPQKQPEMTQPRSRQPARRNNPTFKKKPVISKPTSALRSSVLPSQPEAVVKNSDAKKVLVIGDFMADSLADGLTETFSQAPDLQIINRSNGSSGFVRQDYYNWSKELPAILSEQKPDVVVMMIGANDRQSATQNTLTFAPDTDEWQQLYKSRIDAFLQATTKAGIPLVWMGQPPYKSSALSQTILSLNELYKTASQQLNGQPAAVFIDVWGGFVDDKGGFTQTGVDVSGQTVRLRGNDGITMTTAGKRKLAFYAEKPLRQLLKLSTPDGAPPSSSADLKSNEQMAMPASQEITRIGPIKLSDLDQNQDDALLGDMRINAKSQPKRSEQKQAPQGRADDFSWPRQ